MWSLLNLTCGVMFSGVKTVAWNGLKTLLYRVVLNIKCGVSRVKKISSMKWVKNHFCLKSFWISSVEPFWISSMKLFGIPSVWTILDFKCGTILNLNCGIILNSKCRPILYLKCRTILNLKCGTVLNLNCGNLLSYICFNPFILNAPFLHPKKRENRKVFWCF